MKYVAFIFYYLYVLVLLLLTGYVVFALHQSEGWFIAAVLLAVVTTPGRISEQ